MTGEQIVLLLAASGYAGGVLFVLVLLAWSVREVRTNRRRAVANIAAHQRLNRPADELAIRRPIALVKSGNP